MLRIVRVEFPALDRLLDYLEAQDQAEIDALKQRVDDLTKALAQARTGLESTIQKES